ncbi:hypothetical protein VNO80_25627 [Phaseolus coccineus]|uniref:Uncharacterized protein n=1 Tax=Phaseolus coccineus TaxID=3886 RepID=A0AAN9LVM5_PHACN
MRINASVQPQVHYRDSTLFVLFKLLPTCLRATTESSFTQPPIDHCDSTSFVPFASCVLCRACFSVCASMQPSSLPPRIHHYQTIPPPPDRATTMTLFRA